MTGLFQLFRRLRTQRSAAVCAGSRLKAMRGSMPTPPLILSPTELRQLGPNIRCLSPGMWPRPPERSILPHRTESSSYQVFMDCPISTGYQSSNVLSVFASSSQGTLVGDHVVVYSNCFSGSVTADLEYINELAGLEQNVILRTTLPAPNSFSGLNNDTTLLQIWTEFLSAPEPQKEEQTTAGLVDDRLLDFGSMKMVQGNGNPRPWLAPLLWPDHMC